MPGLDLDLDLEILLPVHNEAESIEATLREIYAEISREARIGFIVCEDGSRDDTKAVLRRLAQELPMRLNLSDERKGYSRALREGMAMQQAEWLLCLDSDGQCDPRDFAQFWALRADADVLLGRRVGRQDSLARKAMSGLFYLIYQAAFHTPSHDPSCPYMLCRREVAQAIVETPGEMQEGFWWEFVARVHRGGHRLIEIPVRHRQRAAGVTQVYKARRMPSIFFKHVAAIFRIRAQTAAQTAGRRVAPEEGAAGTSTARKSTAGTSTTEAPREKP